MIGGWASSFSDSYTGGQLKYAGYDGIVIEGRASTPVYLWIYNDVVEIRDATHLWGKDTWETLEIIRTENKDPSLHTVSIGPAGENLCRGASITQDTGRSFGRCGNGAVMGSKNLKAIVVKGTGSIKVADPDRFSAYVAKCRAMYKNAKTLPNLHKYGTLCIFARKQEVCGIPYKNFQETRIPDDMAEVMHPWKICDKYRVSQVSFPGCAVGGCGRVMHITEGPYAGLITECNQWEAVCETQPGLNVEKAKEVYGVDNPDKAQDYEGKAEMVKSTEVLTRVCNSFGVCIWNSAIWDVEMVDVPQLAELYSAATGWETTVEDLRKLTMKQLNLEKAFNLRFTDFDRKDDMPTPRDLNEPIPTGDLAGWKIDEAQWNRMLDDYYDVHDWDSKTSFPTRKALADLELDYVADELEKMGKLGH